MELSAAFQSYTNNGSNSGFSEAFTMKKREYIRRVIFSTMFLKTKNWNHKNGIFLGHK